MLEQGFLGIELTDSITRRVLLRKYATAVWDGGYADKSPGKWIIWPLQWGEDWPQTIDIQLKLSNVRERPRGTVFVVSDDGGDLDGALGQIDFLPDPVSLSKDRSGNFKFWVQQDSNLNVDIQKDHRVVFADKQSDLPPGMRYYRWNLKGANGQVASPGSYVACLTFNTETVKHTLAVAVYFEITP